MKKLIFIALLIAPLLNNAQNELVLNQVLLVELTATGVTVPDGKVWKVESAMSNEPFFNRLSFLINDVPFYFFHDSSFFPIWLPAETTLKNSTDVEFLSVLEFNLVPLPAP